MPTTRSLLLPTSRRTTAAPRIAPMAFGQLAEGNVDELARSADLQSLRYDDVSVSRLDLRNAAVERVHFDGLAAPESDLRGARLSEVELNRANLPVVRAAQSHWRDVLVKGRLGSIEAYESNWHGVHFVGCKLTFLNLRGAELVDVAFTDCIIEELDLLNAALRRVAFTNTTVRDLNVQDSQLQDVDLRGAVLSSIDSVIHLRGATVSSAQLDLLAPVMADSFGLKVQD